MACPSVSRGCAGFIVLLSAAICSTVTMSSSRVNVRQRVWPDELFGRATSILEATGWQLKTAQVRNAVLGQLGKWHGVWNDKGFGAVYNEIAALDALKGRRISVRQTDDDASPVVGVCDGIQPDGSLDVGGVKIYAGEAHVQGFDGWSVPSGIS